MLHYVYVILARRLVAICNMNLIKDQQEEQVNNVIAIVIFERSESPCHATLRVCDLNTKASRNL